MEASLQWAVRKARMEEAIDIARVHILSWQTAYNDLLPARYLFNLNLKTWTIEWKARLQLNHNATYVAAHNSDILGWISLGFGHEGEKSSIFGEILALYLDPKYWGQGVGKKLLSQAEFHMRAKGLKTSILWVLVANIRARHFYEKAGYAHDGQVKWIVLAGKELLEFRYQKDLKK